MIQLQFGNWVRGAAIQVTTTELLKNFSKAAGFDDVEAHFELSVLYGKGQGVELDLKKELHHLEKAAIGGHPMARYNLACCEEDNGNHDRAMKHYIIAANLGDEDALDAVKHGFAHGYVSKEDFEAALRGHQAAVDATKSAQRDKAHKLLGK